MNKTFANEGESIFSIVSALADPDSIIDLGQGYPAYSPPDELTDALEAVEASPRNHQYAASPGRRELREALVSVYENRHDRRYDPEQQITITAGATEALHSALMGLLNEGDPVVLLEPVYDQYAPVVQRAGGCVQSVPLREDYSLPVEKLRRIIDDSTRLLLLNTPHNPTGRVFDEDALRNLVEIARDHDVILLSDEVYEHLYYEDARHIPLARVEGAAERTLTVGSAGKSFDATGWKLGWILGNADLMGSVRVAHQYVTYCVSTPLQEALTEFLNQFDQKQYFRRMREEYEQRRSVLLEGLRTGPFEVRETKGSYFVTANVSSTNLGEKSPREKVQWLIDRFGVAAVPMEAFYRTSDPDPGSFRFAFCKDRETLREASERLS
jgi:N-succinyldiaminopimelate aminotransferase